MKLITTIVILVLAVTTQALSAPAQDSRVELYQLVMQLQKTPADTALREKIIKLAATMKPAPAIPEESERRMARGVAAFEGAKSVADYQDAIKEFQAAVDAAPWYGDAYFKLGFTQDKAEKYAEALQSLKWAQMAAPDAKNIKTLIYEVEFRNEKYNSPEAKAAKAKTDAEAAEKDRPTVVGHWVLAFFEFEVVRRGDAYILTGEKIFRQPNQSWRAVDVSIDAQHIRLTAIQSACSACTAKYDLTLSSSGNELTGKIWTQAAGWETALPGTRLP